MRLVLDPSEEGLTNPQILKGPLGKADIPGMRPLPDLPADSAPTEPRLELLADEPVEEEPETAEAEPEDGDEEDKPAAAKAEPTQDPLKLYVRAIGDGPLLTPAE